ncbi:MAG: DEAD/DEAH box helicase [Shewanella sp.]|nr:DEAD/DEAH box helicase [Shewanella sp.]
MLPFFLNEKPKLTPADLYPHQQTAITWQCSHPKSMLWIDYGLGKTAITLSSFVRLKNAGIIDRALIVAPLRVASLVWRQEAAKWTHLKSLRFSMIMGNKKDRLQGLMAPADLYLVNYENLKWVMDAVHYFFIRRKKSIPFTGLIWDEITNCKNPASQRVRAIRYKIQYFTWVTGLTGGPLPNGYIDLFGQYLVVDGGVRLGTRKQHYLNDHFYKTGFKYNLAPNEKKRIHTKIKDITLQMSDQPKRDLPKLPPNVVSVQLPPHLQQQYDDFERELYLKLASGAEIIPANKAVLGMKCLQFANGAVYPEPGHPHWENIHSLKLDALEEIISSANSPILCAYQYVADAQRILERFKSLRPLNLSNCRNQKALDSAIYHWKTGQCPLMIGHPKSMGEGIDGLQDTCHTVIWFGLTWKLDHYQQFNARIDRTGQKNTVIIHEILCDNTLDHVQKAALASKKTEEVAIKKALQEHYNKKYQP